jgi:hypothetical protein
MRVADLTQPMANGIILENLAGLDQPPARCRIVVAPPRVRGANGGPARVLALIDDQPGGTPWRPLMIGDRALHPAHRGGRRSRR